jgi:hypothetical protein
MGARWRDPETMAPEVSRPWGRLAGEAVGQNRPHRVGEGPGILAGPSRVPSPPLSQAPGKPAPLRDATTF